MKNYLVIGTAALAISGSFVGCSQKKDLYNPDQDKMEFLAKYASTFKSIFGEISEDQTWGFGSASGSRLTRGVSANGNQWADPAYDNLLVPPPLTPDQIAVVKKYFQTVKNPTYEDPQWTNYFIQQVYKGHTDVPEGCATPEAYMAADGQTYIIASDHMDHLAAIDGDFVDHNNNFNHGDCGVYGNVLENGGNTNDGPFYQDKINLMTNSTTKSFGYFNSNGSVRHTEYTGLVNFQTIIDALGDEANCLNDGWNRSFMGFDFEQMVDNDVYATDWQTGEYSNLTIWGDYYINGEKQTNYVYQYNGQPVKMLSDQKNRYCGEMRPVQDSELYSEYRDANNNNEYLGKQLNTATINQLLDDGYLPVQNKDLREWVKVGGCADGYYSDWIVCLTKAQTSGVVEETTPSLRIICEDISVEDKSDFDFNDLVLDVEWLSKEQVQVTVQAAGGTLPISVAGSAEVHQLFINANPGAKTDQGGDITVNTMINTNAQNTNPTDPYTSATLANLPTWTINANWATGAEWSSDQDVFAQQVRDHIAIVVTKEGTPVELTAEKGKTPGKVAVGKTYTWKNERQYIGDNFKKFVSDPTYALWWKE